MALTRLTRRHFLARAGLGTVVASITATALGRVRGAEAAAQADKPAPGFTLPSTTGAQVSLADQRGKIVVLEWTNHDCPYVKKHYETGNMQALQREATGQGIIWFTVVSSAPGEQGFVTAAQADELTASRKAAPTAVLLDPKGTAGRAYGATNTPHMYVITRDGVLAYAGAIDDKPTTRRADVQGAQNYVRAAIQSVTSGQPVKTPATRAYGCTVKYL
ncbi:MAG: redoxin domain-containing protein [Candidatus Rokubacteria bacterium]|nr:redoxin domain-containing protein [Candidatus Rokubacteria bacterium]